ncbi:M3 family metallopeptidase [Prochlorococcus sp. MIT 1300]|uniref:M3 family metallopeptidase n=1 Tax=Prochlorococcus sp. MIT 1300 TaxID=3096218 RepID=UPI002A74A301|nr:M3 family metallopeptidase [Prochlorococcus sp. MIT 1300]
MNFNTTFSKKPALLKGEGLPEYSAITPEEVNEHIPSLLSQLNKEVEKIEKELEKKLQVKELMTWDEVMKPLYLITEKLRWSWGLVSHLNAVCNSKSFRESHARQQPEVVRFSNMLGQSQVIYKALCELRDNPLESLNATQVRVLTAEILSMDQRGVGLRGKQKEEFNSASEKLAQLSTAFSNHVLDATQSWSLLLTKQSQIQGLPDRALEILADAAKTAGDTNNGEEPSKEKGPWRVGLDMPRYLPFQTHAENRELREVLYKAFVSRASNGEIDNSGLIEEILILRQQQAERLKYKNWAELSLSSKMASNVEAVETLLEELRKAAIPTAQKELKELQNCAKRHGALEASELAAWDINFWSEKLRQEKLDLDQEALRPWFPLPQVLDGLFNLCERLFGISIKQADGEAPIWHKDVRYFKIFDHNDKPLASFYLDPFSRPESKRGGAWMDECLTRRKLNSGETVLPVAYLVCNQTPPVGQTPSLMSFEEVKTLFHEFGHGLQHMLTTINYPQAAGINNIEWDAVELPSQFMENWCLDRTTLFGMARHWQTKKELPEEEFNKLVLNNKFNAGLATLRQVHFALTDLRLHSQWNLKLGITPDQLRRQISTYTSVIAPIEEDQLLCSFSHIFAGGYAAGYYSYKWAEVLSADAFAAFEEVGLDKKEAISSMGKSFRETFLSLGGSLSPDEIFHFFRGRAPTSEALIRHSGLTN